jgi:ATP/maltotriose-dependent transcriptional regulator MalT
MEEIMEELKQEQMQEQQESVEEKPTTSEEKATRTYTQEEVNEIKKNAIAEGMRKASKQQANQNNDELEKLNASLSEKDSLIAEREKQLEESQKELTAIKQVNKMSELGIDKKYQQDVIALIKGRGEEVNEESIVAMCEAHPEWKVEIETGINSIGQTRQTTDPYEEARAKKEKEINEMFRL